MTLVVGTDEAGYGPNLGPLVVAATAWEVAAAADDVDGVFTAVAADLAGLWGDSKQIFRGGAGLSALERGVLAAAGIAMGSLPATWRAFAAALAASHPADGPPAERLLRPWLAIDGRPFGTKTKTAYFVRGSEDRRRMARLAPGRPMAAPNRADRQPAGSRRCGGECDPAPPTPPPSGPAG